MRSLVMDGVRPRPVLGARTIKLDSPATKPARLLAMTTSVAAPALDGIRRPIPRRSAPVVDFGTTEEQLQQNWIETAVAARYKWAGLVAAGLLLPVVAMGAYKINGLHKTTVSRGAAVSSASTAAAAAPPLVQVQAATTAPQSDPVLQQLLHDFTNSQAAPFGVVIKDLKTGIVSSSSPDDVFTSASLYKLFVAQAIYKQVDLGKIGLGDSAGSTGRNVQGCLQAMITVSDNDCGRALGSMLGWNRVDPDLKNLGFKNTSLSDPQRTSAADVALLLDRLYQGTLLSPSSTQQFLSLLKSQKINNRLPVGLPAGTVIAHKTGDLDGFVHDAGIVYGPKTDYLIVLTSGPWRSVVDAPAVFADLSSKVFAHLNP